MKYSCSTDIHMPRDKVATLFDDRASLKRWQHGLRTVEHLEGVPGEVGAKHRLTYQHGSRTVVMVETVTERALPGRMTATYETDGVWNSMVCRFEELDAETTRWTCESEFRFGGIVMSLMGLLMPGRFRTQTEQTMAAFKSFAEEQTDEGLERTRFEPQ